MTFLAPQFLQTLHSLQFSEVNAHFKNRQKITKITYKMMPNQG